MADRIPGIVVDGSNGAMVQLAQSISLARFIKKHNDPTDPYHLDEHQVFCLGFQFKDGVIFVVLATIHMLLNLVRLQNTGWQYSPKQFFSFAEKKFGADTKVQQCGQHASGI